MAKLSLHFLKTYSLLTVFLSALMFLNSCSPGGTNSKRIGIDEEEVTELDTPEAPTFSEANNFFELEGKVYSNYVTIPKNFNDSIYLKGDEVDSYIRNDNNNDAACLVFHFEQSDEYKVYVAALTPTQDHDYSENQTYEWFFKVQPGNKYSNKTHCQTPELESQIEKKFDESEIAYSISEVCENCMANELSSSDTYIYNPSGYENESIIVKNLHFNIGEETTSFDYDQTCSESSECQSRGYDCCSSGQCINAGAFKPNATSDADYQQALSDTAANQNAYIDYPNIYYTCGTNIIITDPDEKPIDVSDKELEDRFTLMSELYACTTTYKNEVSICTTTFKNASTSTETFATGKDDLNFSYTYSGDEDDLDNDDLPLPNHSIDTILYGQDTLYSDKEFQVSGTPFTIEGENNNASDSTRIENLNHDLDSSDTDTLKIKYKINGTCEQINSRLGKCKKYYVQGQNIGDVDDHYPASQEFILPEYADTDRTIVVEIDGDKMTEGSHWNLDFDTKYHIKFDANEYEVKDNQTVLLTYYVDISSDDNVMASILFAKEQIEEVCNCGNTECSLAPAYSGDEIVEYKCIYPGNGNNEEADLTYASLSMKTAPHLFFDKDTGTFFSEIPSSSSIEQEGQLFEYTSDNKLKPNNAETDGSTPTDRIGFNEIYGSFENNRSQALPATMVQITEGKLYDISVSNQLTFSNCANCGTDYFSNQARIFSDSNFIIGAGLTPDSDHQTRTDPMEAEIRMHDMIYGRACFLPATMIPWTHKEKSSVQTQRKARLDAQHFLFANGYQRDWFGFNYGSVIGSFDGVWWFSVGNARRIKATSSRLFLAINAFYSDLTTSGDYTITVQNATGLTDTGLEVTTDFDSEGASCRQYHTCDTDSECVSKLGWDYMCANISKAETTWPEFYESGFEIPNDSSKVQFFTKIEGASAGGENRCVYRGRGAPCMPDYSSADSNQSFNGLDGESDPSTLACAPNYYCQEVENGTSNAKFNLKINRYAKSTPAINDYLENEDHEFGLAARVVGRPYDYIGTEEVPSSIESNLSSNDVDGICLPGKDPEFSGKTSEHQDANVDEDFLGDQVLGIGVSQSGDSESDSYYGACPTFDAFGNYFFNDDDNFNYTTEDIAFYYLANTQNISTNHLDYLEGLLELDLVKDFNQGQVTEMIYEENRCMRAPNATCFSDLDCAPNKWVTDQIQDLLDEVESSNYMNYFEGKFWQEELICHQEYEKDDDDYDLGNNRCCRATGNQINIPTQLIAKMEDTGADGFEYDQSTGVDYSVIDEYSDSNSLYYEFSWNHIPYSETRMSSKRTKYTRGTVIYQDLSPDDVSQQTLTSLIGPQPDSAPSVGADSFFLEAIASSWKTVDEVASRTCCTKNWVRNFHAENGDDHIWEANKLQNFNKSMFVCTNWTDIGEDNEFDCNQDGENDNPLDGTCPVRNINNNEAEEIMEVIHRFELLGIPQVPIPNEHNDGAGGVLACSVSKADLDTGDGGYSDCDGADCDNDAMLPGLILESDEGSGSAVTEMIDSDDNFYYAADDITNFDEDYADLKQVFSRDTFSCCVPAGDLIDSTDDPETMCCTGNATASATSGKQRCVLPEFSNVSVYFNRFVSSAASGVSDSDFDANTGFMKDPEQVALLACYNRVCEHDKIMYGVAHSYLPYPGYAGSQETTKRFIESNRDEDNPDGVREFFDAGVRWNIDVYCSSDVDLSSSAQYKTLDCSAFD